ncbi:hypothetical protein RUM43_013650 [Polyplax serrata]|uniref:Ubiquitin carboxyl-terminal hydrolase n=1 Tax=Polyplax serrata TaxID=468196 RepID=A0AAN8S2T8_POLSC
MPNELIQPHLSNIKIPNKNDKIYKDECVLSYDTPESENGLYISLTTFMGFGKDYVDLYYNKTKHAVFLHYLRTKTECEQQGDTGGPDKKITRLAIGLEGGFDVDVAKKKYTYTDNYSIVILPKYETISIRDPNLPDVVKIAVKEIIDADSALKLAELRALTGTWDGEQRFVTKHASNLLQLDNGKKVPLSGWKCELCDLTQNLWLNLTDGSILCGRKYHDGSGGNNHAVQHSKETGYPLAVKLGTITKEGKGDVYSYDETENDMVEDPYLAQHLLHFGIDVSQLEKTEKTMVELELDLNQKIGEWSICQELGSTLVPVYGPGRTGMVNLGNSCYLNSVMQVIFTIPGFVKQFVDESPRIVDTLDYFDDPAYNFVVQMSKLGFGLCSGKYSQPPPESVEDKEQKGISPKMFKAIIGMENRDFASNQQQDAQEFFLHLINMLERHTRPEQNPSDCFKFQVEDKFQCNESKKVKYMYRNEYCLPIPIPVETATNKEQVREYEQKKAEAQAKGQKMDPESLVRPHIKFSSCLEAFSQPEIIERFYSSAINRATTASKTTRLSSFPDYLLIHLKKFYVNSEYQASKLDVSVEMPDVMDLTQIRGCGRQPGEELLPEVTETPPAPVLDEQILSELIVVGFNPEAAKKAVYFTTKSNISKEQHMEDAMEWIMQHMKDSDFESPFVPPGISSNQSAFTADESSIGKIMDMGFTREQAIRALKKTNNNLDVACDWILEHVDDVMMEESNDGSLYRLRAFISHMGTSSMVGHYVCHILKDGQWIIYNDNKVALSENPPKDLGYLYLYERINSP